MDRCFKSVTSAAALASMTLLCSTSAYSQLLPWGELAVGLGNWNMDVEGTATDNGDTVDLKRDLAVDGKATDFAYLSFTPQERGWVPHAYLYGMDITARGNKRLENDINFGGAVFAVGGGPAQPRVLTEASIDELVLDVFWQLFPAERVQWFAGLEIKSVDAEIVLRDSGGTQENREEVSIVFPMLNLRNRWNISEDLVLDLAYSWISYEDSTISDLRAGLGFTIGAVTLEGGYWRKDYDIEDSDDDYAFDAEFDGMLFSGRISF